MYHNAPFTCPIAKDYKLDGSECEVSDLEVMGLNPGWVETGLRSTSV